MKYKMVADQVLKRFSRQIRKEDAFRATGITEYMNRGGTIDLAQRIAGHQSSTTTKIYDRSRDRLTLAEIERVSIEG
jgi:integrase